MVQRVVVVCVHIVLVCVVVPILFLSNQCLATHSRESLVYVQTVFRHGDRAPVAIFPTFEDKWNVVDGQLSEIGVEQHRAFGRYLRDTYLNGTIQGLSGDYHPDSIYVRSTDYDRTVGSAMSMLKELYPDQAVPIPVHTVPKSDEILLKYWSTCPSYSIASIGINEKFSEQIERDTTFDLSTLHTISGFAKGTYPTAEFLLRVWDNVVCMEAHGIDIPQEISSIRTEIDDFVKRFYHELYIAQPDDDRGIGSLALMHQFLENFEAVVGTSEISPRMMFYSAHDNTLIGVHDMLGLVDHDQSDFLLPGYANSIIFELWRDDSSSTPQHSIRARRGIPVESSDGESWTYSTEPLETLCLDSKKEVCPLHEWSKRVKSSSTFEQGCCHEVEAFHNVQCREYTEPSESSDNAVCDAYRTYCPHTACGPSSVYSSVAKRCLSLEATSACTPDSLFQTSNAVLVASVVAIVIILLGFIVRRFRTPPPNSRTYGSVPTQSTLKFRHE